MGLDGSERLPFFCSSSYQNLNSSESCRQESGYLESGALLTGLARGTFFDLEPALRPPWSVESATVL